VTFSGRCWSAACSSCGSSTAHCLLHRADRAPGREDEAVRRLQTTIPGFGPIVASAFYSLVGDGQGYRRGRDVAAALGLVPAQHSTGGKAVLLGISKRGDRYLRCLLVHGARAVTRQAADKDDPLSTWLNRLVATVGFNKATVALANKLARIGWAVLRHRTAYQPPRPARGRAHGGRRGGVREPESISDQPPDHEDQPSPIDECEGHVIDDDTTG